MQNARTSKAICAAALASPVLATPLTPGLSVEIAGARLLMNQDGTIKVQSGATEIGQGADTVFSQMGAETVGVPVSDVRVISTQSTDVTPFDPGAFASTRQSLCCRACAAQCGTIIKRENHRSRRSHATSVSDVSAPDKRPYRAG
ncbi:molybdopterin cofactor-binding domain-containing protein [Escherichia coli]